MFAFAHIVLIIGCPHAVGNDDMGEHVHARDIEYAVVTVPAPRPALDPGCVVTKRNPAI